MSDTHQTDQKPVATKQQVQPNVMESAISDMAEIEDVVMRQPNLSQSTLTPNNVLQLQRLVGNQAVGQLLSGSNQSSQSIIQRKPLIQRQPNKSVTRAEPWLPSPHKPPFDVARWANLRAPLPIQRQPDNEPRGLDIFFNRSLPASVSPTIQRDPLKVGPANDKYEQQANEVADHIMRSDDTTQQPTISHRPTVQRAPLDGVIQRETAIDKFYDGANALTHADYLPGDFMSLTRKVIRQFKMFDRRVSGGKRTRLRLDRYNFQTTATEWKTKYGVVYSKAAFNEREEKRRKNAAPYLKSMSRKERKIAPFVLRLYRALKIIADPLYLTAYESHKLDGTEMPESDEDRQTFQELPVNDEFMLTIESFKLSTNKGRWRQRGNILSTIDRLINQYVTFRSVIFDQEDLQERLKLLDSILLASGIWQRKYQTEYERIQLAKRKAVETEESVYEPVRGSMQEDEKYAGIFEYLQMMDSQLNQQRAVFPKRINLPKMEDFNGPEMHKKTSKAVKKYEDVQETYDRIYSGGVGHFYGTFLPGIIHMMVPHQGDKSKFEIQLRFPIMGGPLFVGGRFMIQAERKDVGKELKVNMEGTAQIGGSLGGAASLAGELGLYLEAKGKDGETIGKLLSYSMYQRFRHGVLMPRHVTDAIWGNGSYDVAEEWATLVERSVFEDTAAKGDAAKKAYIETGLMAGLKLDGNTASVDDKGIGFEVGAHYMTGKRWDKASVKGSTIGVDDEMSQEMSTRKKPRRKSASTHRIWIYGKGKFGVIEFGGKLKLDLIKPAATSGITSPISKTQLDILELELNLTNKYKMTMMDDFAAILVTLLETGIKGVALLNKNMAKGEVKNTMDGAEMISDVANPMADLSAALGDALTQTKQDSVALRSTSKEALNKKDILLDSLLGVSLVLKLKAERDPMSRLAYNPTTQQYVRIDGKTPDEIPDDHSDFKKKFEGNLYYVREMNFKFLDSYAKFQQNRRMLQIKAEQQNSKGKFKLEFLGAKQLEKKWEKEKKEKEDQTVTEPTVLDDGDNDEQELSSPSPTNVELEEVEQ